MHKNHKYRRMVDRLPKEMKELMKYLDHECIVIRHHAGSMGWAVHFEIKKEEFSLVYDRGSLVVIRDPSGEERCLSPNRNGFNSTISDIAAKINNELA